MTARRYRSGVCLGLMLLAGCAPHRHTPGPMRWTLWSSDKTGRTVKLETGLGLVECERGGRGMAMMAKWRAHIEWDTLIFRETAPQSEYRCRLDDEVP